MPYLTGKTEVLEIKTRVANVCNILPFFSKFFHPGLNLRNQIKRK